MVSNRMISRRAWPIIWTERKLVRMFRIVQSSRERAHSISSFTGSNFRDPVQEHRIAGRQNRQSQRPGVHRRVDPEASIALIGNIYCGTP